jgi:hypothetical protein
MSRSGVACISLRRPSARLATPALVGPYVVIDSGHPRIAEIEETNTGCPRF